MVCEGTVRNEFHINAINSEFLRDTSGQLVALIYEFSTLFKLGGLQLRSFRCVSDTAESRPHPHRPHTISSLEQETFASEVERMLSNLIWLGVSHRDIYLEKKVAPFPMCFQFCRSAKIIGKDV